MGPPERSMAVPKKADVPAESSAINQLPEIRNRQLRWATPAARRADFNRYRARQITLRVDQRYTPLVPSQLRMMTTTEELPDPEPSCPERSGESGQLSGAQTIDKPLSDGGTVDTAPSDKNAGFSTSG